MDPFPFLVFQAPVCSESESCVRLFAIPWLYSPWNSPGQNSGVGSLSLLQGIFQPRDRTQVSCIAGGFFTSWATREAQGYWMGSPSLLQGIFPTQGLNWGLLYYRCILYQLSYQGSLYVSKHVYLLIFSQVSRNTYWGLILRIVSVLQIWTQRLRRFPNSLLQDYVCSFISVFPTHIFIDYLSFVNSRNVFNFWLDG